MKATVLALIAVCLPAMASADIFQWTDTSGVTHYTNLKAEVPEDAQASLQVVVDETARRTQSAGDTTPNAAAPTDPAQQGSPEPSQAQLLEAVYDQSQWLNAYLNGLQHGLEVGTVAGGNAAIEINAPLVAGGSGGAPYYDYASPYAYGYGWPYGYAVVGASFPRRGFHRGLRPHGGALALAQRLGHTPLAITLNPMLLQSLPRGAQRGMRFGAR
ncbi:MAG TPA: DUF4124 domain-containing protein [Candidatus Acidoferrales bacterium]|nr:DUF4124 domain-containing protein [Candidatus Acidoferrales bacterium]